MPPMSVLIKPASGNCNMQCDYCFYCDEQKKRTVTSYGMMEDKTLRNIMRKTLLHSEGMCTIAFQGGEPTLAGIEFFKKVVEYEKHFTESIYKYSMLCRPMDIASMKSGVSFLKKITFWLVYP